jgi:hypothetical protein
MRSRGYRVSDEGSATYTTSSLGTAGCGFWTTASDSPTSTSATRPRWDLAGLTAALGDDLIWNSVGNALDPFEPRQIRAARQRLHPALARIHKLPVSHLTISEHPTCSQPHPRAPATSARRPAVTPD